jgi:hypothetical protein
MDITTLIQRLQAGETVTNIDAQGNQYTERKAPTALALQAARTLQQFAQMHESNVRVINQLNKDIESLNEQIQLLQSTISSGKTS